MTGKKNTGYEKNIQIFRDALCPDQCFDVVERRLKIGGRSAVLYQINGFVDGDALQKVIQAFMGIKEADMPENMEAFCEKNTAFSDAFVEKDEKRMVTDVLAGHAAVLIEGYAEALILDVRDYPSRSIEEPEKNKVLRGARDGFSENIIVNTALLRRRLRSPELRLEICRIGAQTRSDVAIAYMADRADRKLLKLLKERLSGLEIDALTMCQETLAECIYHAPWWNPFPKFKYCERPDTAAACLLEGNIVILVDNSPSAMILPSCFFDIIEEADDYYFPPVTAAYLRISRLLISLLAVFLTPLYVMFIRDPSLIPDFLQFISPSDPINVLPVMQFLILELAVDGLRLAAVNTPNMLSTPLSVIAGIVLGDFAVESGWFNGEVMLYMAFVTLANYSQTSFEVAYALKFLRIQLLILAALFGWPGFIAGTVIAAAVFWNNRTIGGTRYLYPFLPPDKKALANLFRRRRVKGRKDRS